MSGMRGAVCGRRVAREGVDHRQHPYLAAGGELVVHEVHGPDIVRADSLSTLLAQPRLPPPLRRLVSQLHAQLLVEPVGLLPIDGPALPPQQDMHAPVAEAYAGLANLLDPLFQSGLTGTARLVPIRLRVKPDRRTGSADRYGPFGTQRVDQRSLPARPQSFRLMTSCSISLSSVRSATIFFSRAFSCSSSRSRFISDGIMPEYFFFQLK